MIIAVVARELRGSRGLDGRDPIPKSRGEALNLGDHPLGDIDRRPRWDVGIAPYGVLARGIAIRIKSRRLSEQHIGPLWVRAACHCGLGAGGFGPGAPEVHRWALGNAWIRPRNRPVEHKVNLRCTVAVAKPAQRAHIPCRQPLPRDVRETASRGVKQHARVPVEFAHVVDGVARLDAAPVRDEVAFHCLGNGTRAADRNRPAAVVPERAEHHADG